MVVCKYFQEGRCRFGDQCKHEHPGSKSFGGNRFSALQSGAGGGFGGSRQAAQEDLRKKYSLTPDDIKNDLTPGKGRPNWIFSSYGPGRYAPVQLFGGPEREQSFEEMRVIHYAATAAGNPQKAIQDANNLYAATEAQIQTILSDVEGAIRYIIDGANQHPNRIDITAGNVAAAPGQQPAFGVGAGTGQPSGFGQPTPFGQAAPSAPSAFGQPSGLGQQQQPAFGEQAFGQPSTLGQAAPQPPFGQSSFGQPSALGQQQQSAFGKPAFGQPSTLGQASTQSGFGQVSPFGQPVPQGPTQPSYLNQTTEASPFTQLTSQGQGFGQPQSQAQGPSPFAKPETTAPFGQPQSTANPFGQPSGFGVQQQTASPFAQPPGFATTAPTTQPAPQSASLPAAVPTAALGTKKDSTKLNPLPKLVGETRRDPVTNKLISWKGQQTKYIDNEPCFQHPDDPATFVHIYFPQGPPAPESFRSSVGKAEEYTPQVQEAYKFLKANGSFQNGIMPSVPPRPEWCSFEL
ncbi:CCCH zinc finger domain-containing protein [Coccidioides immitis RS]|uniref:CCCH zinc finger domain-containing protein n=1 Tax=Coccidioides immitis (strain RS) TaxID=246410 RepID=J3KFR6_COCIM|nr:CCCH zinc finger domain-containing protein [Coccidioides immitis RS]EAS34492.3 CCCH zinc finger domain-containing protein [Coccidioides immitis RS]TPX21923.1 hypothetical protein DIZ76_015888 [Coccidioides immitis]